MTVAGDGPGLRRFAAARPYQLDRFQRDAARALESGQSVLVCAPTGAGKTVVGEFAVTIALQAGGRCFYTTPIKALSNQKFHDFVAAYGAEQVGLLTGDNAINPRAPIVVMTTEVLRNMIYASPEQLTDLATVVLDEVHYLADTFRGSVWEEVIIQLPETVRLVGLSATVSNAAEFGQWLSDVRGDVTVIVDEHRPVPLWQHVMVERHIYDLFAAGSGSGRNITSYDEAPAQTSAINPQLKQAIARAQSAQRPSGPAAHRQEHGARRHRGGSRRPKRSVPRPMVVRRLDSQGLLPAITFIFSRAGCDAAVASCIRSDLTLTSVDEQRTISDIVATHTAGLAPDDLQVLDFDAWRAGLLRGIAAHHAGLLPVFKQTVEELFTRGLVKVVFATETLALGINMPARTVVLERLVKFNGEGHAAITAGQYTQLTGRAGRRGIDVEGHGVVLWSSEVDVDEVAGLASARTFPLDSSFRPAYNMVLNLVARAGLAVARSVVQRSFAQFQTDKSLVRVAQQKSRADDEIQALTAAVHCTCGDIDEYLDLTQQLARAQRRQRSRRRQANTTAVDADLQRLRRGDVIHISSGRRQGLAAVIIPTGRGRRGTPLTVVTAERWAGSISADSFTGRVVALGHIRVRPHVDYRNPKTRRDIASAIASSGIRLPTGDNARRGADVSDHAGTTGDPAALSMQVRAHPVHRCQHRDRHIQQGRALVAAQERTTRLATKIDDSKTSLARDMDCILSLLTERGYLAGHTPTEWGSVLQRLWCESDLLIVECLRARLWQDMPPDVLAAAVSTIVFEARRNGGNGPALAGPVADATADVRRIWRRLAKAERHHGAPQTREPDDGFAAAIATWVHGGTLGESLLAAAAGGTDMTAGDFVRWSRQVSDVLRQLGALAPNDTAAVARRAAKQIQRGVVAMGT